MKTFQEFLLEYSHTRYSIRNMHPEGATNTRDGPYGIWAIPPGVGAENAKRVHVVSGPDCLKRADAWVKEQQTKEHQNKLSKSK